MSVTRRSFLRTSAIATLITGFCLKFPVDSFAQAQSDRYITIPESVKRDPLTFFSKATFQPYVTTEFRVLEGERVTKLTLLEVRPCEFEPSKDAPRAPKTDSFTLIFLAERELSKARTIYDFEHDALGSFSLFVKRQAKQGDEGSVYYEAPFNHLV